MSRTRRSTTADGREDCQFVAVLQRMVEVADQAAVD